MWGLCFWPPGVFFACYSSICDAGGGLEVGRSARVISVIFLLGKHFMSVWLTGPQTQLDCVCILSLINLNSFAKIVLIHSMFVWFTWIRNIYLYPYLVCKRVWCNLQARCYGTLSDSFHLRSRHFADIVVAENNVISSPYYTHYFVSSKPPVYLLFLPQSLWSLSLSSPPCHFTISGYPWSKALR